MPRTTESGASNARREYRIPKWCWLAGPFLVAALYYFQLEWIGWLTASAFLFAWAWSSPAVVFPSAGESARVTPGELVSLTGICLAAVLLTLGAHRPNPDDAYFVSLIAATLDNPTRPLNGFDSLFRTDLSLTEQHLHFVQTYELVVALTSHYTQAGIHDLYYIVFPIIAASAAILAHWILMRRFLGSTQSLVGVLGVVLLFTLWGDGHTYGNFALVRLFQGKAVLVAVGIPVLINSCLEFRGAPTLRNGVVLMLHLSACAGFASSGLVVAPLTCVLVLLPGLSRTREFLWTSALALATSVPLLIAGGFMLYEIRGEATGVSASEVHAAERGDRRSDSAKSRPFGSRPRRSEGTRRQVAVSEEKLVTPKVESLGIRFDLDGFKHEPSQVVLGEKRRSLVLLGLLLIPILASLSRLRYSSWLSWYVFVSSVLLLCPLTGELFQYPFARLLMWRIFWCWPVPLLLGLAIGASTSANLSRPALSRLALVGFLIVFALASRRTMNEKNWSIQNLWSYKVTSGYAVAIDLQSRAPIDGLALAPEDVAINLCTLRNAPPMLAVRRLYLRNLLWATERAEFRRRLLLLRYVAGDSSQYSSRLYSVRKFISEVRAFGISTIAYVEDHPHAEELAKVLPLMGFEFSSFPGYTFAIREPVNLPRLAGSLAD